MSLEAFPSSRDLWQTKIPLFSSFYLGSYNTQQTIKIEIIKKSYKRICEKFVLLNIKNNTTTLLYY